MKSDFTSLIIRRAELADAEAITEIFIEAIFATNATFDTEAKEVPERIEWLISGGQTGADRAVLDWVLSHNLPRGRCCPNGRKAEDGIIVAIIPAERILFQLLHPAHRMEC